MKEILKELNQNPGIKGSMVMTHDGIVAASELGPDLEEDVVAAISSTVLTSVKNALKQSSPHEELLSFFLTATDGKLVFVNLGEAYLVVLTKRDLELNASMVEIQSAVQKIQSRSFKDDSEKIKMEAAGD